MNGKQWGTEREWRAGELHTLSKPISFALCTSFACSSLAFSSLEHTWWRGGVSEKDLLRACH